MIESLNYTIDDHTIITLLGTQNFSNKQSAVLELVKNAFDARSNKLLITFLDEEIQFIDDGSGMSSADIKNKWMRVGRSEKGYSIIDKNNEIRILSGSMGIGRFALSRLGDNITLDSKSEETKESVRWTTNWNENILNTDISLSDVGTTIHIRELRDKWNSKEVLNLVNYLEISCIDIRMKIVVKYQRSDESWSKQIENCFLAPCFGSNCVTAVHLNYDSSKKELTCDIKSDEFLLEAKKYCSEIDLNHYNKKLNMVDELKNNTIFDNDIEEYLEKIGNFSCLFYFGLDTKEEDVEKFLYKYQKLNEKNKDGVVLYRNNFTISSFEGSRDWLEFGKRSRKSPAATSHLTGAWRVRENQISGWVKIDKKENSNLKELSNRQGMYEDQFYLIFQKIITSGIGVFERYRQKIIRSIDVKNKTDENIPAPVSQLLTHRKKTIKDLTINEEKQLINEIKQNEKDRNKIIREKIDAENNYRYDLRILNLLATIGLKAASEAHETLNTRNILSKNCEYIVKTLKNEGFWDILTSDRLVERAYTNIPQMLNEISDETNNVLKFVDTMLTKIEKQQFHPENNNIQKLLEKIIESWTYNYTWIKIQLICDDILYYISPDVLITVFDNLIMNSVQQNDSKNKLHITIKASLINGLLNILYSDDGVGLNSKYLDDPRRILDVHETSRKDGHGLGMWIVNSTIISTGGTIYNIGQNSGFSIEFKIGSEYANGSK